MASTKRKSNSLLHHTTQKLCTQSLNISIHKRKLYNVMKQDLEYHFVNNREDFIENVNPGIYEFSISLFGMRAVGCKDETLSATLNLFAKKLYPANIVKDILGNLHFDLSKVNGILNDGSVFIKLELSVNKNSKACFTGVQLMNFEKRYDEIIKSLDPYRSMTELTKHYSSYSKKELETCFKACKDFRTFTMSKIRDLKSNMNKQEQQIKALKDQLYQCQKTLSLQKFKLEKTEDAFAYNNKCLKAMQKNL